MAMDMFIKIGSLKGESRDKTHKEEIDVLSPSTGRFQWVAGGVYQSDLVSQPNAENWLSLTPGATVLARRR